MARTTDSYLRDSKARTEGDQEELPTWLKKRWALGVGQWLT